MRRLPRASGVHLKCFTAFVTYASPRSIPAFSSAASSNLPDGPTNGWPARSSWSPGCSPTMTSTGVRLPSPNTVCVPTFHRWQPRHPCAAVRSAAIVRRAGRKSAALLVDPVELGVLVRFVVLLAILVEAVLTVAVRRDDVVVLGRTRLVELLL